MFIHNLKYTIKTLFKNKVLIFWTFAFPIILGLFFNMAFSNIEKDEMLQVFDIAVVDNEEFRSQDIYVDVLSELSNDDNLDKLFNIKYVSLNDADELLDDAKIEGYIFFKDNKPNIVVKESGTYQTIIRFVIDEIEQNKIMVNDLVVKEIEEYMLNGNYSFNKETVVSNILDKINKEKVNLKNISNSNLSYMTIEYYTLFAMACM